ncbi:MAG: pyridoxal 5'-phosphate synthase glutaminase subunit PdxT [Candidatus Bathyarchaeia archaeon]
MTAEPPKIRVGVLNLQGAVSEHVDMTNQTLQQLNLPGQTVTVKNPEQLDGVHGLIIPGGESTTIGRISKERNLIDKIVKSSEEEMPIMGTCAGAIILAKEVYDARLGNKSQPLLALMDVRIQRNAFGRQKESFEAPVEIPILGSQPFKGVFIRSPVIERTWGNAEPLASYENRIVSVRQNNLIATSFHPELSGETRLHQYFIKMILESPLFA